MTRQPWAARLRATLAGGSGGMLASTGFSIGTKALQAVASFATVHRLVLLWGLSGYGLWVTLAAVALYISLFDVGVGYGVKNRISEAWGRGNVAEATVVVRVGVAIYCVASLAALVAGALLVLLVSPFREHALAAGLLWVACVATFFLSFHNMVLQGLGRFKTLALLSLIAPCAWFTALQLWPRETALPLPVGAAVYAAAMLLQAGITVAVSKRVHDFHIGAWYRTRLREFQPLVRTGARFLVLQLASFALNGSGSFLIYRTLGGAETAQYDAANRVFSVFTIAFTTLIAIAWTEISKAKAARDRVRAVAIHRLLHAAVLVFLGAAMVACVVSEPLTLALTGIRVPSAATAAFVLYIGIQMLAYTSAVFLNAYERLRGQILAALLSIPLFFAAALVLLAHGGGMPSIPIASAVATLPSLVVCFVIARRLLAEPRGDESGAAMPGDASAP